MSSAQAVAPQNGRTQRVPLGLCEDEIHVRLVQERERLLKEAGLAGAPAIHFRRPTEHAFTRAERDLVTILFGGLSFRHEELLHAALSGLGYHMARVPTPTKADFQAGKEYGNNGQCSPTYFTVGSLVNYLKELRDRQGLPTERILKDYVFMTAGACGPCRFGMYEAEYRLALRNSGFDGFRVVMLQQEGGLNQVQGEAGVEINLDLTLGALNATAIGDVLNEVAYQIRPYEIVPGSTNKAMAQCLQICQDALRTKGYPNIRGGRLARLASRFAPGLGGGDDVAKFVDQLRSDTFHQALRACRDLLDNQVQVDFTRVKPIVKVTGEFWAQTTEGDGNYRMFSFLEGEGAHVLVEPILTWFSYLIHYAAQECKDLRGLSPNEAPPRWWDLRGRLRAQKRYWSQRLMFMLADAFLVREYDRLRQALGGTTHRLVNQLELQRLGHPYYNSRTGGGEGHLEVAKNIYYANRSLAHMVVSLKPFGCMPSTQSDGAQAAVISHYPDMLYLPIETSGEGDINAYSRAQMTLGEAKVKCKNEFQQALARTGYSLEQIQAFIDSNPQLRRPIQAIPHHKGVAGVAANFVLHVGTLMHAGKQRSLGRPSPQPSGR